jgi:hypothetical protein
VRISRLISGGLLAVAIGAGTLSDRVPRRAPVFAGGYRVLAGDFHVHTFPASASTIAPWDVALEAQRQGLDVIAVAGHNEGYSGKAGSWFSRTFGGPIVLASEEVHTAGYHLIAVGIHRRIGWRLPAIRAIEDVHRQSGVAIAAHPVHEAWPAYDAAGAIRELDGAEVLQPLSFSGESRARELHEFFARSGAAAIASSDWHGLGPVGLCRTYVFVREATASGVLEAIRAHRTLVLDDGRVYGDQALAQYAGQMPPAPVDDSPLALLSRVSGVAGLIAAVLWKRWHL